MQYLMVIITGLITMLVALGFYFLQKKTKFGQLSYVKRQIIIGVVFGGVAIASTEMVYLIPGTIANVRDSAPLLAGFLFGGPAGIIAGCIGGIERAFATLWGRSALTQWGCTIATILAGFYAAIIRKYLFHNKRPHWAYGLAAAVVMEVIHLSLVFLTNIVEPSAAIETIKQLLCPIILGNAITVTVPLVIIQIVYRDKNKVKEQTRRISTQARTWLLVTILICFFAVTSVVFIVQTNTAYQDANNNFLLNINDVCEDVNNSSNEYLGKDLAEDTVLYKVIQRYKADPFVDDGDPATRTAYEAKLREFMVDDKPEEERTYELASVDIIRIDDRGTFACSSMEGFDYSESGYHMMDGAQSQEIHEKMSEKDPSTGEYKNEWFVQQFMQQGDTSQNIWKKYAAARVDDTHYIAISLDSAHFYTMVNEKVYDITSYRHVKSTGFILIMQWDGTIVSDDSRFIGKEVGLKIEDLQDANNEYKRRRTTIYEDDSFYMYTTAETYKIAIVLPYSEVLASRDTTCILMSFSEVIVFAILYILIYILIDKLVVIRIRSVNESLDKIIKGDLNTKVEVNTSYEFEQLSNYINYTVDTLKQYIKDAEQRIDAELAFAKAIQSNALPSTFPAFPDRKQFDIYATMDTAKEVGGDFYDFYIVDDSTLAFLIADVSGKGIPAAMFMMESKAMIKNFAKNLLPANEVLTNANEGLSQNNKANMFVTCWFGLLNFKTGHVKFANAGHNYPLLYRKGEGFEYISQKKNIVLGALDGVTYTLQEFDLKPGDRLYLYTDGVTEATRTDKVLYGEDRLKNYLNSHKHDSLEKTLKGVKKDIDRFVEGADQFDDITMLILEYKGD